MIIRLPKNFIYSNRSTRSEAHVENGILYVTKYTNFEDLMYTMTYALKGYDRCFYCGTKLTPKTRTMDHMYPRRWGGISIPENLLPCCKKCNQDKKDMTYDQFQEWRKLGSQKEKDDFYQKCLKQNLKIARSGRFVLKEKWLSKYDIREVLKYVSFDRLDSDKSKKLASYYRNWNQYPHPVVVSSNDWIIKGMHILNHAKDKRHKVMAIILENVVVIDKDSS